MRARSSFLPSPFFEEKEKDVGIELSLEVLLSLDCPSSCFLVTLGEDKRKGKVVLFQPFQEHVVQVIEFPPYVEGPEHKLYPSVLLYVSLDHGLPVPVDVPGNFGIAKAGEIGEYGLPPSTLPFALGIIKIYEPGTPGVLPTRAIFFEVSALRREDLPTFDLPTKQTSGSPIAFL